MPPIIFRFSEWRDSISRIFSNPWESGVVRSNPEDSLLAGQPHN